MSGTMAKSTFPHSKSPRNDLRADYVQSILDYEPATGVFRWRWRADKPPNINARDAGKIAGATQGDGYRIIKIDDRSYRAHRLAWLISTGAWPSAQIDHISGDRLDNCLANLREATHGENMRNSRRCANNTSGFKGVSWDKRSGKWLAHIKIDRRSRHLGSFDTPEEAHAAYCEAANRLHGKFARLE
jgi:hypothetical protein